MRRRVTLGQLFTGATIAIAIVVITAFTLFVRASHASILRSSQEQQRLVAGRVEARVVRELGRAQRVLENVERGIRTGALDIDDQTDLEQSLFTRMVDESHLEEVTFTRANLLKYDEGEAVLAEGGRWELSVYRSASGGLVTKTTRRGSDGKYVVSTRDRGKDPMFGAAAFHADGTAPDPTTNLTFSQAATEGLRGTAIWSDLHWSELDHALPQRERRVVVSVQKAVDDAAGKFLGVVRVGIVTNELDAIARVQSDAGDSENVQRIALLATAPKHGAPRLVARINPSDRMVTEDDEIRVVSDRPPPEIRELLKSAVVRDLDRAHPNAEGSLVVDGEPWLATLREIELGEGGTSGWMVAILAPESRYTADLAAFERRIITTFAITIGALLAIGAATVFALRRGLERVTGATTRMRGFDFQPAGHHSAIKDIDEVMYGLERAKTVVRAMGKFVPIDLVRRLYERNEEPELGGEMQDVALMFTDIEGFTTLAEKLPPDVLAKRLGDYLAAMTGAIESTGGTIDKYIGDAVMAIWNAPTRVEHYGVQACRATLACMKATKELYASSAWSGLPALHTRFGIHEARVMVGNFGAPTRLTYTALGDGVNLAARLEPLCKQYGVSTLVSEAIVEHAKDEFVFRRIDRVAVKGKTEGIDVYELLGAKGEAIDELERARRYEEAFDAYLERDFERAITLVQPDAAVDPPSAVLVERCRQLVENPPPPTWKGVHVASTK
ncbi:MAG: adenylate cyclase [Myxococcales bacterium]|nr:adenylate cyclase [Myxococcales bacterium]